MSSNTNSESGLSRDRDNQSQSQRELPVFTFPNQLKFYADDKDSLRQILTLYNPYEFPVKYRVFSTAPKLYSVVEAQGTVKPGFCADIVIRHNSAIASYFGHTDKFRIQLYEALSSGGQAHAFGAPLGKKTVESLLLEKRPILQHTNPVASDIEEEQFRELSSAGPPLTGSSRGATSGGSPIQWQPGSGSRSPLNCSTSQLSAPSPVIFLLAMMCISALCLPTENSTINSHFPVYLHLTINQKLVAAYVLGLITMVIFRS